MTDRHSTFSPATPPKHDQSTTQLPPESTVPVPTTPEPRPPSPNIAGPSGRFASAPELRKGHRPSNTTPLSLNHIPSTRALETKPSLDPQVQRALSDRIIEVETDAFVRAVLYKGAETKMKDHESLAAQCLSSLPPLLPSRNARKSKSLYAPAKDSPSTTRHPTESAPDSLPRDLPRYAEGRFTLIHPDLYVTEESVYSPLTKLLEYVRCFFRERIEDVDRDWAPAQQPTANQNAGIEDIDVAWLPAQQPTANPNAGIEDIDVAWLPAQQPTANPNAGPSVPRVFRNTRRQARSFTRKNNGPQNLKPDICLLIEPEDKSDRSKRTPKESEDQPKVPPHWKDVVVAFEIKKKLMDLDALVQIAEYARAMMLEQYDRIFVITVLLAGKMCRVFHWDVVGAHVTEAFDIHKDPKLFLQVMGRLATMTPSELGYDTHFSNAGRVLSCQADLTPYLRIHSSTPHPLFIHDPKLPTPECSDHPHPLVLKLDKMQFESKGVLFHRATRVWRATAVNDPPDDKPSLWSKGTTYIVKQNWADDKRPNEGFFHQVARDVKAVPRLVMMEEREFTCSFHARFEESEIKGIQNLVKGERIAKLALNRESLLGPDSAEQDVRVNKHVANRKVASKVDVGDVDEIAITRPLERVLLRFVFGREGRPLSAATNSIELLKATVQWITGLIELDDRGITHRDISYGNLLLPPTDGPDKEQASIIDLGLAHLQRDKMKAPVNPVTASEPGYSSQTHNEALLGPCQPHHHVTGTLPFVAWELLFNLRDPTVCIHGLHHDVESVFWVLLYVSLTQHGDKLSDQLEEVLRQLTSSTVASVVDKKFVCLQIDGYLKNIGGKFGELEGFLVGFVDLHKKRKDLGTSADFAKAVSALASHQLKIIQSRPEKRKMEDTPETESSARSVKRKEEKGTDASRGQ